VRGSLPNDRYKDDTRRCHVRRVSSRAQRGISRSSSKRAFRAAVAARNDTRANVILRRVDAFAASQDDTPDDTRRAYFTNAVKSVAPAIVPNALVYFLLVPFVESVTVTSTRSGVARP
jgi:hypothetical protein